MSIKPSLLGILSPIVVPVLFFLGTYFLFPDFSYNFYGTSFKHRKDDVKAKIVNEENVINKTDTLVVENVGADSVPTISESIESYDYQKDVDKLKDMTTSIVKTVGEEVGTGVKKIKNVFEYPDGNGTSKDVLNKYKNSTSQE